MRLVATSVMRLIATSVLLLAACSSPEPNTYLDAKPQCDGPLMDFAPSRIVTSELQGRRWVEVETTTMSYDRDGRLIRRIGPQENTVIEYFDGRVDSITEDDGEGTWHKHSYDDEGLLTEIETLVPDAGSYKAASRKLLAYDDGRIVNWRRQHIAEDGHTYNFERDKVGEGVVYAFDDSGLILSELLQSLDEFDAWQDSDSNRRWTWTPQGRLAGLVDSWAVGAAGHSQFEYDGVERVVVSYFTDAKSCVSDRSETRFEGDHLVRETFDHDNSCGENERRVKVDITYTTTGTSEFWELDPRPSPWLWTLYGSSLAKCR